MNNYTELIVEIFNENRNGENAVSMEMYMKKKFKFLGINRPERNIIQQQILLNLGVPDITDLSEVIKLLWDLPYREYQYFALDLLAKFKNKVPSETINLYSYLITTKSWWDSVDIIASQLVGPIVKKNSTLIDSHIDAWSLSKNIWLKRTSIIYQLRYKKETDTILLSKYIKRSMGTEEFFLNKAIGWALREYGKVNPQYTIDFVASEPALSNLSRRESLRRIEIN